jgi:hypothetical protein
VSQTCFRTQILRLTTVHTFLESERAAFYETKRKIKGKDSPKNRLEIRPRATTGCQQLDCKFQFNPSACNTFIRAQVRGTSGTSRIQRRGQPVRRHSFQNNSKQSPPEGWGAITHNVYSLRLITTGFERTLLTNGVAIDVHWNPAAMSVRVEK